MKSIEEMVEELVKDMINDVYHTVTTPSGGIALYRPSPKIHSDVERRLIEHHLAKKREFLK